MHGRCTLCAIGRLCLWAFSQWLQCPLHSTQCRCHHHPGLEHMWACLCPAEQQQSVMPISLTPAHTHPFNPTPPEFQAREFAEIPWRLNFWMFGAFRFEHLMFRAFQIEHLMFRAFRLRIQSHNQPQFLGFSVYPKMPDGFLSFRPVLWHQRLAIWGHRWSVESNQLMRSAFKQRIEELE